MGGGNDDSSMLIPNMLGSATAGIISRLFTHPLDTAKSRLQAIYIDAPSTTTSNNHSKTGSAKTSPFFRAATSTNPYRGPLDVLVQTFRTEGISGLYRGFGAVIVGGTPGTVLYLCSYDIAKKQIGEQWESRTQLRLEQSGCDFFVHFAAGLVAESICCVIYVPVDVVKERMQVQRSTDQNLKGRAYKNSWDALKHITKTEGMSGIYKGYGATLASFGSFSALYFVFYEKMKHWTRQYIAGSHGEEFSARSLEATIDVPFPMVVFASAGAGALASWVTSPLDMAKLRLQVQRGNLAENPGQATPMYRGVVDCLRLTYREGGLKGLFRGAGARVLHFTPAMTITMTCYEACRSFLAESLNAS